MGASITAKGTAKIMIDIDVYFNHTVADTAVLWYLYLSSAAIPASGVAITAQTQLFIGQIISPTASGTMGSGLTYVDDLGPAGENFGTTQANYFIAYKAAAAGTATFSNGFIRVREMF